MKAQIDAMWKRFYKNKVLGKPKAPKHSTENLS